VFPPLALSMIKVGEETGQLDIMLIKVAAAYEKNLKETVKRFVGFLESIMILAMGLVIGSKIIKFAIPAIVVLFGLVIYQYGYIKIRAEVASVREMEVMKSKTLEKYITIIAEKPFLENKLVSLKEKRKADDSKIIEGQTFSLSANTLEDIVKGIITGRGAP